MSQRCMRLAVVAFLFLISGVVGCATVGPRVSRSEIKTAKEQLETKGFLRLADQQQRVWEIGHKLLESLPAEDRQGSYPEVGIMVAKIDKIARRAFGYPKKQRGVCVLALRDGGPAIRAGVQRGDIVLGVEGKSCSSVKRFQSRINKLTPGAPFMMTVMRAGQEMDIRVVAGSQPRKLSYVVSFDQMVNAWANGSEIGVTGGLVRFIESDDELASVLGHELAHITGSHRGKKFATGFFANTLGAIAGVAVEVVAPGVGGSVMNVASNLATSAFSRGFEREADYRGLLHAYRAGYDVTAGIDVWERFGTDIPESLTVDLRSTHPASPERMVRMRKIVESLGDIGLQATIAKYEGEAPNQSAQVSVEGGGVDSTESASETEQMAAAE